MCTRLWISLIITKNIYIMKTQRILIHQNGLRMKGMLLLLMFFSLFINEVGAQSTERTVSGVVQSVDGPVMGATVLLKGTLIGTHTDKNGKFTFPQKLKENDVLVCSALGYDDGMITISGDAIYVEPFLEDNPVVIVAALRTVPSTKSKTTTKN